MLDPVYYDGDYCLGCGSYDDNHERWCALIGETEGLWK